MPIAFLLTHFKTSFSFIDNSKSHLKTVKAMGFFWGGVLFILTDIEQFSLRMFLLSTFEGISTGVVIY